MSSKVNEILTGLKTSTPDIIGAAVVRVDGLLIASSLQRKIDEDFIGGMCASMLGIGERISTELMMSTMEQVYVRSPEGFVIVNAIDLDQSLVMLVSRQAKLGLVLLEMKRAAKKLAEIFYNSTFKV